MYTHLKNTRFLFVVNTLSGFGGAEIEILNKLIDQNSISKVIQALVETHEKQMPELFQPTKNLRVKIKEKGITHINLNWV